MNTNKLTVAIILTLSTAIFLHHVSTSHFRSPHYQNGKIRNFGGEYLIEPTRYITPQSEAEIISVVRNVSMKQGSHRVRVIGTGHSWSPLVVCRDVLISLDDYKQVLDIDFEKKVVVAQAGIKLKELNSILWENGLALSNLGTVAEQSLAGAISTSTHGTGAKYASMSTQMISFTLVVANGTVIEVSREQHPEIFRSASVGMGMFGIISTITLQCEQAFYIHKTEAIEPLDFVLYNLGTSMSKYDYYKFWVIPYTNSAKTFSMVRTPNTQVTVKTSLDEKLKIVGLNIAYYLWKFSSLSMEITKVVNKVISIVDKPDIGIYKSYEALTSEPLPTYFGKTYWTINTM
eukprot:TRINITY_DN6573_c0_g1_i2.p1 TRINITY_DN6573_c0_g1~~TRINITY_DN6573_c0_g1_i2.p1  ORF type:complete len:346 (-),score=47.24 TRINITY_DN6573_c0_g1_i2:105-1142(-)